MPTLPSPLRLVAWEVTRRCNLACVHCRAAATENDYPGELEKSACLRLLDDIACLGAPVVILTGGEPLLRNDILDLVSYGTKRGLRMVMATNGTLLTKEIVQDLKEAGIRRVSVSLDGPDAEAHDRFRGVTGAFAGAMQGIEILKDGNVEVQINSTITDQNFSSLAPLHELAVKIGAKAHHIFLLVPVGRGRDLTMSEVNPQVYEDTLTWFAKHADECPIELKATCAPHFFRIYHELKGSKGNLHPMTRGCLGGISFCFISHRGDVQPCGYLEVPCGNVQQTPFPLIWEAAPVFQRLRDLEAYKGKCGHCEFKVICGGCRARAYEMTGDYLEEEPLCSYQPEARGEPG